MSITDPTPSESPFKLGPVTETNLAWAEQRHAMLARLAMLSMRLAEEIVERAVNSPYHPEPRHEPGRAYANVARAVRFSLVLQARVEQQIIAIRRGEPIPPLGSGKHLAASLDDATARSVAFEESPRRDHAHEACDTEAPARALDHSRENLIENETYDDVMDRPMGESVEAICAELGVAFDASLWSDDVGADPVDAKRASAPEKTSSDGRPQPAAYLANTHEMALEGIPPRSEVISREPERVAQLE